MKRYYIATVAICLAVLAVFSVVYSVWDTGTVMDVVKVGFIYENDETAPYTYNFALARDALEAAYPGQIEFYTKNNVLEAELEDHTRELARKGCHIIFTNTNSNQWKKIAAIFPNVQFCQVSNTDTAGRDAPRNYHTFNGKIYQGRYIGGIVAGMKLKQLIESGEITPNEALVGFVGAYPTPEVISGFTAFFLGVRSVAPQAMMRVRYTYTWTNYSKEKACAQRLIDEGCVIIGQHCSTIGPAVACEETTDRPVFHVGYNASASDMAPKSSLVSMRINWSPYILSAVEAVRTGKAIESQVRGDVHGNDVSAGFEQGWVEMMDLNKHIAAEGTQEAVQKAIEGFRQGKTEVFRGDYEGVYAFDSRYTYDLNKGYAENKDSSMPTFAYILREIQIEE